MRQHPAPFFLPVCVLLLSCLTFGCQKSLPGFGIGSTLYTRSQTLVLAEPDAGGRVVASVGPNAQVVVSQTKGAYSRVSVGDGRSPDRDRAEAGTFRTGSGTFRTSGATNCPGSVGPRNTRPRAG